MNGYASLLPFLGAVMVVGLSGIIFRPGSWYQTLKKPSWTRLPGCSGWLGHHFT